MPPPRRRAACSGRPSSKRRSSWRTTMSPSFRLQGRGAERPCRRGLSGRRLSQPGYRLRGARHGALAGRPRYDGRRAEIPYAQRSLRSAAQRRRAGVAHHARTRRRVGIRRVARGDRRFVGGRSSGGQHRNDLGRETRFHDPFLSGHYGRRGQVAQEFVQIPVGQGLFVRGGAQLFARKAGLGADAPDAAAAERRRPDRSAGQQPALLRGTQTQRREGLDPRLPHGRPRLGHQARIQIYRAVATLRARLAGTILNRKNINQSFCKTI